MHLTGGVAGGGEVVWWFVVTIEAEHDFRPHFDILFGTPRFDTEVLWS